MTVEECEHELYYIVKNPYATNFMAGLFRLLCKADKENRDRISKGFPAFVIVVRNYQIDEGYWEEVQKRIEG